MIHAAAPDPRMIARVAERLNGVGITPILIGGMAMVIYGSTRATRDCDFAAEKTDETLRSSVHTMLDEGFAVIFGWDGDKYEPTKLELDKETAGAWAVIDRPESIWFWHSVERIRIDLVFDLPMTIEDLLTRAEKRTIQGVGLFIAAPEDLRRMKEHSFANRPSRISDEQDLVYLRHLLGNAK